MADNAFVPDFGGRFVEEPGSADTYRVRTDADGVEHQVLKNYYSEDEFRNLLQRTENLEIHIGPCYWWVMYETPSSQSGVD
jgi:hypothetical protein